MAKFYNQQTDGVGHMLFPNIAPLNGLQIMASAPVVKVVRAQDFVAPIGRRIIASGGLRGSQTWSTPNTDPTAMAGTHPAPDERRFIGGGSADVTPGNFLNMWAVASPSGATQFTGTADPGGVSGSIELDVTWTDQAAATVTQTYSLALPASIHAFGAEPTVLWDEIHRLGLGSIQPPGLGSVDELARWSQHVNVQVEIYAVGGARVIDCAVFENPLALAKEADDAAGEWTSHIYSQVNPAAAGEPLNYPFQRFSETTPDGDPRGGTFHIMDVHHAQAERLGPVLFHWSAARESDGAEDLETMSNTFVEVTGSGTTDHDDTEPGLCSGCGGYARRQVDNSEFVLRDRVAAIPVFVRALVSTEVTASVLRVATQPWSRVDVAVPVGALDWQVGYGWLEVGINPDQRRTPQIFFAHPGGEGSVFVRAITVHYAGGYAPAA